LRKREPGRAAGSAGERVFEGRVADADLALGVSPLRYATPARFRTHRASQALREGVDLARRLRVAADALGGGEQFAAAWISLRDKMAKLIKSSDENVAKGRLLHRGAGRAVGKEVAVTDWLTVSQERIEALPARRRSPVDSRRP